MRRAAGRCLCNGFGGQDSARDRVGPVCRAALQPAFFHNGAFTKLEDAIRHHLDAKDSARHYNPIRAGVDQDLTYRVASPESMLNTLDPLLAQPIQLNEREFSDLVSFVRNGLEEIAERKRRDREGAVPIVKAAARQ